MNNKAKGISAILAASIMASFSGCVSLQLPENDFLNSDNHSVNTGVQQTISLPESSPESSEDKPAEQETEVGITEIDSLKAFLKQFDRTFAEYESDNPFRQENNIIMNLIGVKPIWNFNLYPGENDCHWYFDEKGQNDPRGLYSDGANSFSKCNEKTIDWVLKNILNVSDDDIIKLKNDGEAQGLFYIENGYYYTRIGGIGWFDPFVDIKDIYHNGKQLYIIYDYYDGSEVYTNQYLTEGDIINNCTPKKYYAVMEYNEVDSKPFWSVVRHSEGKILESDGLRRTDPDTISTRKYSDWFYAYSDFIENSRYLEKNYNLEFGGDFKSILIRDLDDDGIPELFLTNGKAARAERCGYCFTLSDRGTIDYIGICPTDVYDIAGEAYPGVVGKYNDMGEVNCTYYQKVGNELKTELICIEKLGAINSDYKQLTSDNDLFNAFVKDHTFVNYIGTSHINDFGIHTLISSAYDLSDSKDAPFTLWDIAQMLSHPSDEYDNRLAALCSELMISSETSERMLTKFSNIGFDYKRAVLANYTMDIPLIGDTFEFGCYDIVSAENVVFDSEPTNILVVVLRGSKSEREFLGDFISPATSDFFGYNAYDNVYNFYSEVIKGVENYMDKFNGLRNGRLKILITGHSLGGAAANLLGAAFDNLLNNPDYFLSGNTAKKDIFCYTFGPINSIDNKYYKSTKIVEHLPVYENYENIHNIYNWYDTWGPNRPAFTLNNIDNGKQKFGHFHFFEYNNPDDSFTNSLNHIESVYKDAVMERRVNNVCKNEFKE